MSSVDWGGYRIVAWVIAIVLLCLAISTAFERAWQESIVLGCFALALILYLSLQPLVPELFSALLNVSVALNAAGWAHGIFDSVWGYDEIAHTLGTLGATLVIGWYGFRPIAAALRAHPWVMLFVITALGISLGALWEIVEWIGFWIFTQPPVQELDDKVSDLTADSIGALIAACFFRLALMERFQNADEDDSHLARD